VTTFLGFLGVTLGFLAVGLFGPKFIHFVGSLGTRGRRSRNAEQLADAEVGVRLLGLTAAAFGCIALVVMVVRGLV